MASKRPQFSSDTTQELLDLLKQKARQFNLKIGVFLNLIVQHTLSLSDPKLLRIIHPELSDESASPAEEMESGAACAVRKPPRTSPKQA